MNRIKPKKIRLLEDYHCWPLWNKDEESDFNYNIDPKSLGVSFELGEVLDELQRIFDKTLNADYPPDSKFNSVDEEREFHHLKKKALVLLNQEFPYIEFYTDFPKNDL